ncbi:Component of IIS longevity pathway SMK-1, putative [Leishmania guyanensis]
MESADPITKAKLFASHEAGEWIPIGLGVVSIVKEPLPTSSVDGSIDGGCDPGVSIRGGGKRGKATDEEASTKLAARLQMFSTDNPNDLLLSSCVSLDDIYTIQDETILVWYDESVSNDLACSFDNKEGCDLIYRQIKSYQQSERLRRVQDERVPALADRFLVHPHNLAGILDAAQSQNKRFGLYVREDPQYFTKLAQLFHISREKEETTSMELIAHIVLALFQSPYNTEGKIVAQLVENERIDDCIDIVQYGLGRRDKESGFVSFEERRATFHDPCHLPESMLPRIHVLYSCGYLRDLIPLSLEPADAASYSLLSTFTLRFTMTLMTDIVASPTILPNAFRAAVDAVRLDSPAVDPASIHPGKVAHLFELAAFIGDVAKTVKNAMIGIDTRTEIFSSLVRVGVLPFLTTVLECALRYYEGALTYPPAQQWAVKPPRAVQLVCDTLYSCAAHFPECIEDLVAEANAVPGRCLLQLLLRTITVVRSSAEAQSVVDVVQCCGVGVPLTLAMFGDNAQLEARRHEVMRFWIEGNVVDRPPLFYLAVHLAQLLEQAAGVTVATLPLRGGTNGVRLPFTAGALQLSLVQERQVVYGLRVIAVIISKADSSRCNSLLELLTLSKLMPALATTLVSPQRRMANLQSSVTSFLATVLNRRDARLVTLATGDLTPSLLHTALLLYLQCGHRDNLLSSSLAHLIAAVCEGVHREKLQGTFSMNSGGSFGPSPFVTILRSDDSISKTEQTFPASVPPARPFEAVASGILSQFGEHLAKKVPVLYERLQKALEETPEQAQLAEAESSSLTSSVERSGISGFADFDAAAIDFGLESPLGTPIVDGGSEARLRGLIHTTSTTSDEDNEAEDDPLASLSSIDDDSDNEEREASVPPPAQTLAYLPSAADFSPGATAASSAAEQRSGDTTCVPSSAVPTSLASFAVTTLDCADPPSGRNSLLEDEESRLPRRASLKRGRSDCDKLNDNEEEESEARRVHVEESAA